MLTDRVEEAYFMRTICADPDDITARLIFADKLEDWGYSAEPEFIRLQCESAKYRGGACRVCERDSEGDWVCSGAQGCALSIRRREQELLLDGLPGDLNWVKWHGLPCSKVACENIYKGDGPIRPPDHTVYFSYRCGFVEKIRTSLLQWCGKHCICDGHGCYRYRSSRVASGYRLEQCRKCKGAGRINALGPRIVALAPVTSFEATDAEPVLSPNCLDIPVGIYRHGEYRAAVQLHALKWARKFRDKHIWKVRPNENDLQRMPETI